MNISELKALLEDKGAVGSTIYSEFMGSEDVIPHPFGDGYEGFFLVELDEGLHALPYKEVIPGEGYEQIDADAIAPANRKTLGEAIDQLRNKVESLQDLIFVLEESSENLK